MKLALGTVQFGLDYGAFGDNARPGIDMVTATLDRARAAGVECLDTAAAYGDSEAVLGQVGATQDFAIVTKVPKLNSGIASEAAIRQIIAESLIRLKADQICGLMAHSADDLLGPNGEMLWSVMIAAQNAGQVERIGVSVYSPEQADAIIARFPIGIIQLPFNVFDQRALQSGLFTRLQQRGIEVHVRSVFLQGLLLSELNDLPAGLAFAAPLLLEFQNQCRNTGCSFLAAALAFVRHQAEVDKILVGVRNVSELEGILTAWQSDPALPDFSRLASDDLNLINPANWPAIRSAS